ncbi:hypothetical protein QFZ36_003386 [Pseudarthrobacter siccitolerans]|uniref:Divergent AAA domain protein n=1 Tax=Pseudarthrobacter siccitolerans TaxID=861266 RepID=A0ABU0PPC2_9MICC|nr:hypothetical protein [Pseudarthrobacter siccitolerans]
MDTGTIPLGERALRNILDHVISVGDEAEAGYLEVKSQLDFSKAEGIAKVAKFLLGAANRRPNDAAKHFHGYAVLVVGVEKGKAGGIPRGTEAHELEDRLRPYLGPQFPAFELGRLPIDAESEVLFVISPPPVDGQTIFPCHKSFQGFKRQDNLDDGAIYLRGASNTRPARAGEVLALVERARAAGRSAITLDVQVLGPINRVARVDEVLEYLYKREEERFAKPPTSSTATIPVFMPAILGGTEPASDENRAGSLATWRQERPEHLQNGRRHFLGVALPGAGIRVVSRDRFVAKPHLIVTFHDCEVFDHRETADANFAKVVEPVMRRISPYGPAFDPADLHVAVRGYPVQWNNRGNNVVVVLTPESFRPNVPWTSDEDDYVLVTRDPHAEAVAVTWVLTEDGSDVVTTGEFNIEPADLVAAPELFNRSFVGT